MADDSEDAEARDTEPEAVVAGGRAHVAMAVPWGAYGAGAGSRRCPFCGRREESVAHLVRSRGVSICDGCVELAAEAIAAAPQGQKLLRIHPRPPKLVDRDQAEAAIEAVFETVLGGDAPDHERCDAIEGGSNLGPAMREVRQRFPAGRNMDVSIEHIRFVDRDEAEVHFSMIFGGGFPMHPMPSTGHAVLVGDEWKMARHTYCELISRVGVQCPPAPSGH